MCAAAFIIIDFRGLVKGMCMVSEYTPGAIGVMEYWGVSELADYLADREMLEKKIAAYMGKKQLL